MDDKKKTKVMTTTLPIESAEDVEKIAKEKEWSQAKVIAKCVELAIQHGLLK